MIVELVLENRPLELAEPFPSEHHCRKIARELKQQKSTILFHSCAGMWHPEH
jgi:hypothetical protein